MTPFLRCGWPFQLSNSSTVAYCTLPMGHDGPWCCLLDDHGHVRARTGRFGAVGVAR